MIDQNNLKVEVQTTRHLMNSCLFDAIVCELNDTEPKDAEEVLKWMTELRFSGLHTYFSPVRIRMTSSDLSERPIIRKFVLSLTERAIVNFSATVDFPSDYFEKLTQSIIDSQARKHEPPSCISKDVAAALTVAKEALSVICENHFLTIIYLVISTGVWNSAILEYAKDPQNVPSQPTE